MRTTAKSVRPTKLDSPVIDLGTAQIVQLTSSTGDGHFANGLYSLRLKRPKDFSIGAENLEKIQAIRKLVKQLGIKPKKITTATIPTGFDGFRGNYLKAVIRQVFKGIPVETEIASTNLKTTNLPTKPKLDSSIDRANIDGKL